MHQINQPENSEGPTWDSIGTTAPHRHDRVVPVAIVCMMLGELNLRGSITDLVFDCASLHRSGSPPGPLEH